jgi:hypothetical protein
LQCSLHGADTGGSFFIVSDLRPRLAAPLARLPQSFDITLNRIGDSSAELTELAPAVFSFPNIEATIAKASASHRRPEDVWNAGDSSAGYSAKRFGTFNMTCEVPLWRDVRERDARDSGRTLTEVVDEETQMMRADARLLQPFLSTLTARAGSESERALLASVEDAVRLTDGVVGELEEMKETPAAGRKLSFQDLVQYELGTAAFRTLAMAQRLAGLTGMVELSAAARRELDQRLERFQGSARLVPVPLTASTGLQMEAILETARSLGRLETA